MSWVEWDAVSYADMNHHKHSPLLNHTYAYIDACIFTNLKWENSCPYPQAMYSQLGDTAMVVPEIQPSSTNLWVHLRSARSQTYTSPSPRQQQFTVGDEVTMVLILLPKDNMCLLSEVKSIAATVPFILRSPIHCLVYNNIHWGQHHHKTQNRPWWTRGWCIHHCQGKPGTCCQATPWNLCKTSQIYLWIINSLK